MISIGVVFYKESKANLIMFFDHLTNSLAMAQKQNCKILEIIFVQNSSDQNLKLFLMETLNDFKIKNDSLKIHLIQNTINNIGLARKTIVDRATTEWIYLTDPDVHLQESVFVELTREIYESKKYKCFGITGAINQKFKISFLNAVFKNLNWIDRFLNLAFQGISKKSGTLVDHAPTAHLLLNKSVTQELGNFSSEASRCGEDLDLTHRATQQGYLIFYGNSQVTHYQDFGIDHALKKFFEYGKAQAFVFLKNGLCRRRLYRLIPALVTLVFIAALPIVNTSAVAVFLIALFSILLLKPQMGFVTLVVLTYGFGTLFGFILELYALITRSLFRENSEKSFQ